jgi:hypothetical protein
LSGLVAGQLGDGVCSAIAMQWVTDDLEHLGIPKHLHFVFPGHQERITSASH